MTVRPISPESTHPIPEDSLAGLILAFARLLKDHGFAVSLPSLMDALRGVSELGVDNPGDFRTLLRATFMTRREESPLFERLFNEFWLDSVLHGDTTPDDEGGRASETSPPGTTAPSDELVFAEAGVSDSQEQAAWSARPYVVYSPREVLRERDFRDLPEGQDERVARLIREIVAPLLRRLGARRKSAASGPQPDFRSLFRRTVRYGGEILELPRLRRRPRIRKLVFLCDVSGSMNPYLRFMLRFIKEIQELPTRVETFVFATQLSRITPFLAHLPFNRAWENVAKTVRDWHGGTRIGACLREFTTTYGMSLLGGSTVVLIFSDGWDRGDVRLLEQEITRIHLRSHRLLWINPLLGSPTYEPTCRGMRTALPYIDSFLPGHNAASLERLAGTLRGILT